jgi:alpha-amylase/alpha-mannosidase (GH57 family)
MWPAEGAVSEEFVRIWPRPGCRWIASGEGVLANSLAPAASPTRAAPTIPGAWNAAPGLTLFFRDERLSDLIGFDYAKWHGRDAARHFVDQLEAILDGAAENETPLVSIILDGENAWEHYPYNGYYFFDDLYGLLAAHPGIAPPPMPNCWRGRRRPVATAAEADRRQLGVRHLLHLDRR